MILDEFVFLAAVSVRSKAYLQAMVKEQLFPSYCIIFSDENLDVIPQNIENNKKFFDLNETLIQTLENNNIAYKVLKTRDINSVDIRTELEKHKEKYVIYSGYGGAILKRELFTIGKKFLHVHAGELPFYRGSTTAYYSILNESKISASSIFLSEEIDEGDILTSEKYNLPLEKVDIDYIYEPYIRSQVLIKTLKEYVLNGMLKSSAQMKDKGETYYVIHPVLKHIAMLEVVKQREGE